MKILKTFATLFIVLIIFGCENNDKSNFNASNEPPKIDNPSYKYTVPVKKNDGWSVASVKDVGVDKSLLEKAITKIVDGDFVNISSILITREGKLIVDELFRKNLDQNDSAIANKDLNIHTMQSATKSFTSALVGIAIDKGFIDSVNTSFYSFFPEYTSFKNWTEDKNEITLENVLTMQHGLKYNEWDYPTQSDQNTLFYIYRNYADFVKGLLDLPMATEPGKTFAYSTMSSHALGAVVRNKSGKSVSDFAEEYLFKPLQFNKSYWLYSPTKRAMTGCCLFISGRDMIKLGQLYLDKGKWNGEQIISSDWVEKSVTKALDLDLGFTDGYGYQWWMKDLRVNGKTINSYFAAGNGGQFIYVIPSLNAVISFTGENYGSMTMYQVTALLENYLLKAFK